MSDRIKFHLDENVFSAIADGLRRRGIDVTTTVEVGLMAATDEEQLAFAHQSGRLLVTFDDDLLRLHATALPHAGIAYCKQGARSLGHILRKLVIIHESMTPQETAGQVLYL